MFATTVVEVVWLNISISKSISIRFARSSFCAPVLFGAQNELLELCRLCCFPALMWARTVVEVVWLNISISESISIRFVCSSFCAVGWSWLLAFCRLCCSPAWATTVVDVVWLNISISKSISIRFARSSF